MNDREAREELKRLLKYANAAEVGVALGKSRATGARWARGEAGDYITLQAVRALLPENRKDAAPEGAAEKLLRLWTGDEAPPWAKGQLSEVIAEIRRDRAEAMTAMARRLGRMTAAELQELLSQLPDGSTPAAADQ